MIAWTGERRPHPFFSHDWQAPSALSLTDRQHDWLTHTGSLTVRLRQFGDFSVRPLAEQRDSVAADEADFLALPEREACLSREVVLCVDDRPCVYARSLLPLSSLEGDNRVLGRMEERSLGSELFRPPRAQRCHLDACWLPRQQLPGELACREPRLLARRSLLMKQGKPFLVAECFLPALWVLVSG